MKKLCLLFFACFLFFSCKNEIKHAPGGNYLTEVVGENNGGKFKVTNNKAIKAAWDDVTLNDTITPEIDNFEIVYGTTQGDVQEEYYLLLAKNKAGDIKTAAPLVLQGDNFYFQTPDETSSYVKITCKSACAQGCSPVIKITEGTRYLLCSACPDCIKVESEMR